MRVKRYRAESKLRGSDASSRLPDAPTAGESRLLTMIDDALMRLTGRHSIAASEVADTLLDLRAQILLDRTLDELVGADE